MHVAYTSDQTVHLRAARLRTDAVEKEYTQIIMDRIMLHWLLFQEYKKLTRGLGRVPVNHD
jgi:hypothetical protein